MYAWCCVLNEIFKTQIGFIDLPVARNNQLNIGAWDFYNFHWQVNCVYSVYFLVR